MEEKLKKLKRIKLYIGLFLAFIIVSIIFAYYNNYEFLKKQINDLKRQKEIVVFFNKSLRFLKLLQIERGYSYNYKYLNETEKIKLSKIEKKVDKIEEEYAKFYKKNILIKIADFNQEYQRIKAIRKYLNKIDDKVILYLFNHVISSVYNNLYVNMLAFSANNKNRLFFLFYLSKKTNILGLIRAKNFKRLKGYKENLEELLSDLRAINANHIEVLYKVSYIEIPKEFIYSKDFIKHLKTIKNPNEWWRYSTNYINHIYAYISKQNRKIISKSYQQEKILQRKINALIWFFVINISIVVFLGYIVWLIVSSLIKSYEENILLSEVFNGHEAIVITDEDANIVKVNESFEKITGYSQKEAIGQNPSILKSGYHSEEFYKEFWDKLLTDGFWHGEFVNKRKNGEIFNTLSSIHAIKIGGKIKYYVGQFMDITKLKKIENELQFKATHDSLTKIYNREYILSKIDEHIKKGIPSIFIYIDLNNFKEINDIYGHTLGDMVLIKFIEYVTSYFKNDIVGRIGGDEFGVIARYDGTYDVDELIKNFIEKLPKKIVIEDIEIPLSVSIGVKKFPEITDKRVEDVLVRADLAMYKAKHIAKKTEKSLSAYVIFDEKLEEEYQKEIILKNELNKAFENNEFVFFYQPQFNKRQKIIGAEMLVRWKHPTKGLLSPYFFINEIYKLKKNKELTKLAIKTGCEFKKKYGFKGALSINFSTDELMDKKFLDEVIQIINSYNLNLNEFEIEILENNLIEDFEYVNKNLKFLKQQGITIAIDDFGTGYSSLSYLDKLNVDIVKIDRKFINNYQNERDQKILKIIFDMANELGIKVVVEGVETKEQVEFLNRFNVYAYQGYYFSKPISEEEFIKLIKED